MTPKFIFTFLMSVHRNNYFLFNKKTDALIFVKKLYTYQEFDDSFSNTSGYLTVLKYHIKTKLSDVYVHSTFRIL